MPSNPDTRDAIVDAATEYTRSPTAANMQRLQLAVDARDAEIAAILEGDEDE